MSKGKQDETEYLKDVKYDPKVITAGTYVDIKRAFASLDTDKSGKLSPKELQDAINAVAEEIKEEYPEFNIDEVVQMIMEQVDENGDGEIDLKEFVNIMAAEPINDITNRKNCDKIYKEFSKGGEINEERLKEIAEEMGEHPKDEDIKRMMVFADADGDGVVNEEEFYNILNPPEESYLDERAKVWVEVKTAEEGETSTKKKKVVKRRK